MFVFDSVFFKDSECQLKIIKQYQYQPSETNVFVFIYDFFLKTKKTPYQLRDTVGSNRWVEISVSGKVRWCQVGCANHTRPCKIKNCPVILQKSCY